MATPNRGTLAKRALFAALFSAVGLVATGSGPQAQAAPPPTDPPGAGAPKDPKSLAIYKAAMRSGGRRIMVSTEHRWLWLLSGRDTILSVPVAVGLGEDFSYEGKNFRFETPRGKRKVLKKQPSPIWTPPDWHYYERAVKEKLELVQLKDGDVISLSDGSRLEVRENTVFFVNRFDHPAHEWTPGAELIFDGKLYVPPMTSKQRRVPDALGTHGLYMGDGYLIHGTHIYNEDSIGLAVSHGCVRMRNEDVAILYSLVPVGTPVFIY